MITQTVITPEIAKVLLSGNTTNRTPSRRLVAQYVRDMNMGNWSENGATIVTDASGYLLDGQHRLMAIVESGLPQKMIVVSGIDGKARDTIDAGRGRTAADNLRMSGVQAVTATAAAARLLMAAKSNGAHYRFSTREILQFIEHHHELNEVAKFISSQKGSYALVPHKVLVPWYFLVSTKSPFADQAEIALNVLLSGVPHYTNDAIHSLRERVIRAHKSEFTTRNGVYYLFSTMNAAWNNFTTRTPVKTTKIRTTMVQIAGFNMENL